MRSPAATADSRLSLWRHVRAFAVPPSMIESATARRQAGDWAGACAAAHVDVELNPRAVARTHGRDLAALVRADLRHLAPDLLRWHMPRIQPDGLLRPGLTVSLARYDLGGEGAAHLVVRTPPGWADAGQRMILALWHRAGPHGRHPHPRPDPRFRLDLHRHLWDARRAGELRDRSAASWRRGYAVARWPAEAAILLRAGGRSAGAVTVRLEGRRRLRLDVVAAGGSASPVDRSRPPVLPYAATWALPDLALLHRGLITVDKLHPLVAAALAPDRPPRGGTRGPDPAGAPRLVECRGAPHRIGLVDGRLTPLDHDPDEVRRERLLAALTGTPLPCLQVIDQAHRQPECLPDIRARLDHGDTAGALAAVEALIGPAAVPRDGALRDELEAAIQRRVAYGLFRAGLAEAGPAPDRRRPRDRRAANR